MKRGKRAKRYRRKVKRPRRVAPIWKRRWKQLTTVQRRVREKSLEALSIVRREKLSLREAAKRVGLESITVDRNTHALRRTRGRLRVKSLDRIPRPPLLIYEGGRKVFVEVSDSRTASLIGKYHNQVKQFLVTGRSEFLSELPTIHFRDIDGRPHTLETNPKAVLALKQRESTPEFFEIYRR